MLPCCVEPMTESDLLDDLKNKPYEVFLNDVMFFLCQECKVLWIPPCYKTYALHPKSPLMSNIRRYILNNFRKRHSVSELKWYYLCEKETIPEFEAFEKYIADLKERINSLTDYLSKQQICNFFLEMLKICIDCIVFYEKGMLDAICFGVTHMSELFRYYYRKKREHSFNKILHHMDLLFKKFSTENHWSDLTVKLPDMFAYDILFYFCGLYRTVWFPNNDSEYKIHQKSPLSINIRIFLRVHCKEIEATCCELQKYCEKGFAQGLPEIAEELSVSTIPNSKSAEEVFLLVARTACTAVNLHMRGSVGILSRTTWHLTEALNKCNKRNNERIFHLFDALAYLHNNKKVNLMISQP